MSDLANVIEVSESGFQQQVIEKSGEIPVLVDFWADWCAPCKMQLPVLLTLAGEYRDQLRIAKVNTDQERSLAEQHGIRSLPTLRLYRYGEVVEEVLGENDYIIIQTAWEEYEKLDFSNKTVIDGRRVGSAKKTANIYDGICW